MGETRGKCVTLAVALGARHRAREDKQRVCVGEREDEIKFKKK